ncbi:MAG: hypothetical protein ACAH80_08465 [Alphaproteobacteria bacterium]
MSGQKSTKITIIIVALFVIGAVVLFLGKKGKTPTDASSPVAEPAKVEAPANTPPQPEPVPNPPAEQQAAPEAPAAE